MSLHTHTLAELAAGLKAKRWSSAELTDHFLKRIEAFNGELNAFISVTPELARERAKQADAQLAAGTAGPLTGLPLAYKDIFCTDGVLTTCGSKILANFVAPYESTATQRFKDAGVVMLGKTNMDEFAMGSSNESSFFGVVKNPWDVSKVPGGSSGGSAAAVAARMVPAATGTDTGGSIRQPCALTGLTGIKPTYGRVSRYGMIAYASSLDQGGVMCQTAEDAALLLSVMAGFDPKDSTSVNVPVPDYSATLNQSLKGLKIGLVKEFFEKGLNEENARPVHEALKVYKELGAEIVEVSLPSLPLSVPAYYVVAPAECSSNLSRFDGVRFGHRCDNPRDLMDLYTRSRGEGFGSEVKRRIMTGTYVLSAGYYDAYYLRAQKVRRLITNDFVRALSQVDVLMGPTTPTPAFGIGANDDDPVTMYLNDIYTVSANLAGVPAMSVPCGVVNHLPVGLQIIGNHFAEAKLLNVAHGYQQATDWHRKMPERYV